MAIFDSAAAHPDSLWAATAGKEIEAISLAGRQKADVVVVGGGFTGLRVALEMAEKGADTALLEAMLIGWGASGRSGGQVNPLPHRTPAEIEKLLPPPFAARFLRAALRSADELFDFAADRGIECQSRRGGWIRAAHCRRAGGLLRRQFDEWRRAGAEAEWLEKDELAARIGSDFFISGTLFARAGSVHPLLFARGLANLAATAGVRIFAGSRATNLSPSGGGWAIATAGGKIVADKVILCVNGYADDLRPELARSIIAMTSIQASTAPVADKIAKTILPGGQTVADTRRTIFYGRREADNRIVFGTMGRIDDSGRSPDFARLKSAAIQVFPQLQAAKWDRQWGGRLAKTADYLPRLCEPAPGLLAGFGYNGRGVAMSQVMAQNLARRALGAKIDDLDFPLSPMRAHPFRGLSRFGIGAAIRWLRLVDDWEIRARR